MAELEPSLGGALLLVAVSAIAANRLIALLMPVLARYALARPNARSSHRIPTPQGGGMAIVVVVAAMTVLVLAVMRDVAPVTVVATLLVASMMLGVVGAIDDIKQLRALPRLVCQMAAAGAVLAVLPSSAHIAPVLPLIVERVILLFALVWFINLTNFMDGLDWITVAEVVPVSVGLVLCSLLGAAPLLVGVVACALLGATLGFAPFNRPVARLFLGDVGSLPIGLMLGWMLVLVAARGHVAAAVLLPLYYLADATLTLGRRVSKGERVWEAHRTHYYQRATDNGYSVMRVVGEVFVTNAALLGLALFTIRHRSAGAQLGALGMGVLVVAGLLVRMTRNR